MLPRHTYVCSYCSTKEEFIGNPDHPCYCGNGQWALVFDSAPQIRTQHASTVDEAIRRNARLMSDKEEEACSPGTEQYNELEAVRHEIKEHITDDTTRPRRH
jgi:hypothetical protein